MTEQLPDGIYFNLSFEDYLGQQRLSSGDIKCLNVSPGTYWAHSHLNPNPPKLSAAKAKSRAEIHLAGSAYHCARLEPDEFNKRYVREIDREDYAEDEDALFTDADIKEALKEREQPQTKAGENVLERAHRLAETGYPGAIWHIEYERFEAERGGREALARELWDAILVDMGRIAAVPEIHALLSGGAAEVSVFWTCPETGIPMKARFDYLTPTHWCDLKTFDNGRGKATDRAITDAFAYNGYYIQAAVYRDAALAILRDGMSTPDATNDQLRILSHLPESPDCWYVFQEKSGIPNLLARRVRFFDYPYEGVAPENIPEGESAEPIPTALYQKACREIARAKALYLQYSEVYRPGEPWAPVSVLGEFNDSDFSSRWLDE